ncbi:MAG: prolipoprotein diacylglyceryl transferase, partial [Deltaproteobacteria bacterium]|nr:prolipoprotein diacylglyceryl transferase [Deltaproteobacteria bacterium]
MRPFLYYSPNFSIPSFAFMLMLASLTATMVLYKLAPRRGLSQVVSLDLGIIGTIMAVIGMRVFHIFVEGPNYASPGYSNYYWEHPTHMWQIWRGGFVSYGAFLGIGVGWISYLKWRKLDMLTYLDFGALFGFPI